MSNGYIGNVNGRADSGTYIDGIAVIGDQVGREEVDDRTRVTLLLDVRQMGLELRSLQANRRQLTSSG